MDIPNAAMKFMYVFLFLYFALLILLFLWKMLIFVIGHLSDGKIKPIGYYLNFFAVDNVSPKSAHKVILIFSLLAATLIVFFV